MLKPYFRFLKPAVFIVVFLFIPPLVGLAQEHQNQKNKPNFQHFMGIQFNPYLNSSFFSGDIKQYPFALRYGWMAPLGISFGPEFSGFFGNSSSANWHVLNFGMFFRYTFLKQKNVSPFAEASGFYRTGKLTITNGMQPEENGQTTIHNGFSYYFAPGISINLYRKKLLLDVMVKLSADRFLNGEYFIPSIRIVYRF